jgi:hypothetical protein
MNFRLDDSARVFVSVLLFAAACRGDDPGDGTGGSTTSPLTTTGDEATSTGPDVPTTEPVDPSTTTTTEPLTTTDPSSSTTDNTNGFITTQSTTDDPTNTEPQPNGSPCGDDAECVSMHCYSPPIAMGMGVCSECESDQDCVDAGTGISCTADLASMQAACAPGELGNNCESQDACMDGLFCEPVIDGLMGFLPNSCSECATSGDCDMGQLCVPVLDQMSFSGQKECADPGSVPNDALCPEDADEGDAACMSGHCGDVDVMGFLQLPVCGECEADSDCAMGQTCTPGAFGGMGVTGATCG